MQAIRGLGGRQTGQHLTPHGTACALTQARRARLTNATVLADIRNMIKPASAATRAPDGGPSTHNTKTTTRRKEALHTTVLESNPHHTTTPTTTSNDDFTNKKLYYAKRQADAVAYALQERNRHPDTTAPPSAHTSCDEDPPPRYARSIDAFGDKSIHLRHHFSGLADNRIITWYENIYWNYLRYFLTQEMLIAKDRWGNKFTVTWQHTRSREEQRRAYRVDRDKRHLPYGSLATDDRLWERWMRGHRADPPSVAEEEHMRRYKRSYLGPYVVGEEEVEQAMMRVMAHMHRAADTFKELDPMQDYDDAHRRVRPMREREASPGAEMAARRGWSTSHSNIINRSNNNNSSSSSSNSNGKVWRVEDEMELNGLTPPSGKPVAHDTNAEEDEDERSAEKRRRAGTSWTVGFARGDLFYNEEEVEVMRSELGHMYRNMEWQNLEYKRQVRVQRRQHPLGKPAEGTESPNAPDGPAPRHVWERTDLGIPYHDAVPDLTTPMLERLRTESDQLEDERLALRKELGLTDLGDIREGRDPIVCDGRAGVMSASDSTGRRREEGETTSPAPFQPPPVSTRWKPRCWEEAWGTGGGVPY